MEMVFVNSWIGGGQTESSWTNGNPEFHFDYTVSFYNFSAVDHRFLSQFTTVEKQNCNPMFSWSVHCK